VDNQSNVIRRSGRFLQSLDDCDGANTIIVGAPMDITSSGRPGSRYAPAAIRVASELIEDYSPTLDRQLEDACFFDAGDILMPYGDVESSLKNIEDGCWSFYSASKRVLLLGGEHLVTAPAVKAAHRAYEDLVVLHFDAHADLRDDYYGMKLSHATVMRRVAEIVGMQHLWQFGIRSGAREEYELMRASGQMYYEDMLSPSGRASAAARVVDAVADRPVYLTIDIDALDPSVAPGTGTPEPGGLSYTDLMDMLLRLRQLRVVGMDLVEVNPMLDASGCTLVAAAKLIRELLLCF
jgi:agmatinase